MQFTWAQFMGFSCDAETTRRYVDLTTITFPCDSWCFRESLAGHVQERQWPRMERCVTRLHRPHNFLALTHEPTRSKRYLPSRSQP